MVFAPHSKTAFVTAAAFALSALIATQASAGQLRTERPSQTPTGFAATPTTGGGSSAQVPEHCNNVSSCNTMIAYCAATGGDFDVSGSDGIGRPNHGTCSW